MRIKLQIIALFISILSFAQNKGSVTGTILDKQSNNQPLPSANVVLKGTGIGVNADIDGKYTIAATAGTYTLQFSFVGYQTVEIPVTVVAGETITINQTLSSGDNNLKEIVVKSSGGNREKETALLLEQKKATEIKQSIGAQEMSRKGISDVEEGLTKVTGITKVDGRGLFVRGLEDRYNNLLINELQAPSNTPFKKIIPLDIFPTDIVGSLNVYKTMNPNISGDFAGATVNIETAQAKGNTTKLSVGYGLTTGNNGEVFLISSDANTTQGFLGNVLKDRELPAAFGNTPSGVRLTSQQSKESYKNNSWNVDESSSPLNSSLGFLHTQKIKLKNGNDLSYIISLNAENKYQIKKGIDRTFNQGQGLYDNNLFRSQYNYTTATSSLLGLKYKAKLLNLTFNSFYLRSTESRIQDQVGSTNGISLSDNVIIRMNQFEQSNFFNNQILVDYKLSEDGKHFIKAGASFVKTAFQQPDRKFIVGTKVNDTDIFTQNGGNHLGRQYLDIKGNYYASSLLEYNYKFKETSNGKSNKLIVGYNGFVNDLSSTYRFLSGTPTFSSSSISNLNNIDNQVNNDIENGIIKFTEESDTEYKAKVNQLINAGYVNLLWNFGEKTEINAGLRFENTKRSLKYRNPGDSNGFTGPYTNDLTNKLNVLPSINVKHVLTPKSNLRLAASSTLTRPVIMEVLPIQYVNADGTVVKGNKDLYNSENLNIDLKYEIFPNAKEIIVVGLFGKSLKNPIERVFYPTASSGGQITTFQNSKGAIILGTEIEFLLQMSRISKSLSNFSFGLNTSLLKSNTSIDLLQNPLENASERKLQGASDWIINSDLKYDFEFSEIMKNSITLVYGVYSDRIFAVGTAGTDHLYEKSFHKLDMIWSSKLSKNIDLKFSIDNILNPSYQQFLGSNNKVQVLENSLLLREYKRGVGYSLNLSYSF